ncbi:tyrosine-type recombinase/integrase [Vibrio natriegens]
MTLFRALSCHTAKGFAPFDGVRDLDPPTFHELRSLSARLYEKQISDKFAQHLLGHKSDTMASQYRDDRGREWDKIEIK